MQVETLTYNDRHRANMKVSVDKKEKSPRFAFLIPPFRETASTHLQFAMHTGKHTIPKLRENLLLPTNKWQDNFGTFASLLNTQGSSPILLYLRRKLESYKIYIIKKIKIAIAGIGNGTSSLVQGIEFYRNKSEKDSIGLHSSEGYESLGYAVSQKSI